MTEGRYEGPDRGVNLRVTNPALFRGALTIAIIFICLGLNFLLPFIPPPTFKQYGISPDFLGAGFLILGVAQIVALTLYRDLYIVRSLIVAGIVYCLFWGVGTTETFFQGTASLQLFVLYMGLAVIQVPLLLSPYFNPVEGELEEKDE